MQKSTRFRLLAGLVFGFAAAFLGGCASSIDATSAINSDPPEKMYSQADAMMTAGKFEAAASKFEELDRSHPYSPEARRAMVLAAYAYYKAGKFPEAIASAERYTVMH
ncbi:MAG: outer membrane protein assembly factor BamD, partial [Hyphomicrobium sp.]